LLKLTTARWSGTFAPRLSGCSIRTLTGGHAPVVPPWCQAAKLPAPKVNHPSVGQVGRWAERTDSDPIEPSSAIRQRVGVLIGSTSSQRSPAAPTTTT
jgi:hypothetical protein